METRLKYFSLIKIPAWLSAEFAETMFLLTGDLWIFDKAIGEDPASIGGGAGGAGGAFAPPTFSKNLSLNNRFSVKTIFTRRASVPV